MAFNIDDLRANLNLGGARPTLFDVVVTNKIDGSADQKMMFTCKAAQLPAATVGTIEAPYFGRKVKLAGDKTFAEWTVTVINDEDFAVRNAMETWHQAINSHLPNLREGGATSAPATYKSQAQVRQYSKDGNIIKVYEFDGLWPSEVGAIDVSWESNDTLEEFTVTFQYDFWTSGANVNGVPRIL